MRSPTLSSPMLQSDPLPFSPSRYRDHLHTMPKETKSYATRIPRSVWNKHRDTIETLFLYEDKTLGDVMGAMKGRGFYARSVTP
jgi:hypothetical protein